MDLESKISAIQSAASQEEAFEHYNRIMGGYGYTKNVYSLVNDHPSLGLKAQHGLVGTYPQDWLAYYHENAYFSVDPIMESALRSPVPFYWADAIECFHNNSNHSDEKKRRSREMTNQAGDAGVIDGICISFVSPLGEVAGVGLAKDTPHKAKNYEQLAEIYLISAFFHQRFRSFLERSDIPVLSARERELLLWASEGKSDTDIADILGLSTPTVRYHWKNIFEKLEVNSRWLAIIKAMRLQIIDPLLIRTSYQG